MIYYRICVNFFDIFINSFFQFLPAVYTDSFKALFCHFPPKTFDQVQPGTMFRGKYKFKASRFCCKIFLRFFRCMGRMVVQYKTQSVIGYLLSSTLSHSIKSLLLWLLLTSEINSPVKRSNSASRDSVPRRLYS